MLGAGPGTAVIAIVYAPLFFLVRGSVLAESAQAYVEAAEALGRGRLGILSLFPGAAIMLAVLSLNVLGDGLRDALDPRAEMR